MNIKTEKDVLALDRTGLCQFLGLHSADEQDTNIEALKNDALSLLEERLDNDEIVFEFDELDDGAKYNVVDFCRPDWRWWEDSQDHFYEEGVRRGLDMDDFGFDMGTSQGGAAWWWGRVVLADFLAKNPPVIEKPGDVYKHAVLTALVEEGAIDTRVVVRRRRDGMFVDSVAWDVYEDTSPIQTPGLFTGIHPNTLLDGLGGDMALVELSDTLEAAAEDFAGWIYAQLQKEDDYFNSFEYASETSAANDWVFGKKGNLVDRPDTTPAQAAVNQLSLVFETLGETL